MRLRRENGDFQIVAKAGETEGTYVVNSIRTGLSAEDLIGEVIKIKEGNDVSYVVADAALGTNGHVLLQAGEVSLIYDPATGNISTGNA